MIDFRVAMALLTPQLDRVVASVHRRMIAARLLEIVGIALLSACAVLTPLVCILLWKGVPALPPVIGLISAAALIGVIWGIVRRPSRLEAAVWIDSQLNLQELLSSAVLSKGFSVEDRWQGSLLAMAEQRSREMDRSRIRVRRFSGRGWLGVVLSLALIGTLTALSWPQANLKQVAPTGNIFASSSPDSTTPILALASSADAHSSPGENPEDPGASRFGNSEKRDEDTTSAASNLNTRGNPASPGRGTGEGRTQNGTAAEMSSTTPEATHKNNATGDPTAAAGIGEASNPVTDPHAHVTNNTAASHAAAPPPPWTAAGWAQNVREALKQLQAGQVPPSYSDLIQSYFQ